MPPPGSSVLALDVFFNDTAATEIYTLSLHDALPICHRLADADHRGERGRHGEDGVKVQDRKSTRLNYSHGYISYAVFGLKKKAKPPPLAPQPPHHDHHATIRRVHTHR